MIENLFDKKFLFVMILLNKFINIRKVFIESNNICIIFLFFIFIFDIIMYIVLEMRILVVVLIVNGVFFIG